MQGSLTESREFSAWVTEVDDGEPTGGHLVPWVGRGAMKLWWQRCLMMEKCLLFMLGCSSHNSEHGRSSGLNAVWLHDNCTLRVQTQVMSLLTKTKMHIGLFWTGAVQGMVSVCWSMQFLWTWTCLWIFFTWKWLFSCSYNAYMWCWWMTRIYGLMVWWEPL